MRPSLLVLDFCWLTVDSSEINADDFQAEFLNVLCDAPS
jgi:hypothetical protein